MYPLILQSLQGDHFTQSLYVPDAQAVKENYLHDGRDPAKPFPFWTRVWPASLALADFIAAHPAYTLHKTVLELAAGTGLPSLVAARYATAVCCSDYLPEAVMAMQQSVNHHRLHHVQCRLLNWHALPTDLEAEVVLASDINYNPAVFEVVLNVLHRFIRQGAVVLLSTPQRLAARPFVEQLLPWCICREEQLVRQQQDVTPITTMVLQHASLEG